MSEPDSEKRLGQWLTDLMAGRIVIPSRLHEAEELGQVQDSAEWPPINLDKP